MLNNFHNLRLILYKLILCYFKDFNKNILKKVLWTHTQMSQLLNILLDWATKAKGLKILIGEEEMFYKIEWQRKKFKNKNRFKWHNRNVL